MKFQNDSPKEKSAPPPKKAAPPPKQQKQTPPPKKASTSTKQSSDEERALAPPQKVNSIYTKPKNPPIVRPQQQKPILRESKGISIDNYDPENRKPFTDPVTLKALHNLGVKEEELFPPSEADVKRYTNDPELQKVVKEQLCERMRRTVELVKKEKDRIQTVPPTPRENSRSVKNKTIRGSNTSTPNGSQRTSQKASNSEKLHEKETKKFVSCNDY